MRLPAHRLLPLLSLTLATSLLAAPPSPSMPKLTLLVANQKDHTLSLIDPATSTQIAAVPLNGITGHEVTATPDGRTAFVPIYGNSGVGKPGTDGSTMDVIDIPSHTLVHTVDFGHPVRPHLPVYDPHNHLLYVTTELDQAITVIDPKTLQILGKIPTGRPESHMLALSPDGTRGYTANVSTGTVSVLDLKARKLLTVIQVAPVVQRISISPDGKSVFTSDQSKPELDIIDTATNTVKTRIPLPGKGYGSIPTPDGRYLLLCIGSTKQVVAIDLATLKIVHTMDMPAPPTALAISPDGQTAVASCGKQVAKIHLPTFAVTNLLEAGVGADGMTFAR